MDEKLSNKKLSLLINEIESEFPVNSITYKGLNIWPYIRINLVYHIWNNAHSKEFVTYKQGRFIRQKFNQLKKVYFQYKQYQSSKAKAILNNNFIPSASSDYIFISENNERKEIVDNKKIHPFADSISTYLKATNNYHIFEYNHDFSQDSYNPIFDLNYIIERSKLRSSLKSFFKLFKHTKSIKEYASFVVYLKKKGINFILEEKELVRQIESVITISKELKTLFKKQKTKAVFYSVYFKQINFSVSLACRSLGIKAIEIQHGQQGDYNPQNNGWANVPEEGYALLPTDFWSWGEESKNRKNDLCASKGHKSFVGGHPWLSSWLNDSFLFSTSFSKTKTNVLIALQPTVNPIPNFLYEALKHSDSNIYWLIRLHPAMKNKKEEIKGLLKGIPSEKYNIEESNSLPLYSILKEVDYLITQWSTVAYEAVYFNAHSIIIHENGKEIMSKYIAENIFSYCTDDKSLLEVLKNKKENKPLNNLDFIETNNLIIQGNINKQLVS